MTLPSSGPISASDINVELGRASNAYFDINGAAERALAGVPSGTISFSDFYGKSNVSYWRNAFTLSGIDLSTSTTGYNFNAVAADSSYIYYATIGLDQSTPGIYYICVLKLDKTGAIVWQRRVQYAVVNQVLDAEVDSNGNLWLALFGGTGAAILILDSSGTIVSSRTNITLNGGLAKLSLRSDGSGNMIVWTDRGLMKLNSSLGVLWSYYMYTFSSGGDGKPALDSSGNIYTAFNDNYYYHVQKYNSSGVQQSSVRLDTSAIGGSIFSMGANTLTVDSSGNIYVPGWISRDLYPGNTKETFNTLIKLNSSYAVQWCKVVKGDTAPTAGGSTLLEYWYSPLTTSTLILPSGNIFVSALNMSLVFDSSGNLVFTTTSGFADRKYTGAIYFDSSLVYASAAFYSSFVMKMPVDATGIGTYSQSTPKWNYFDYSVGGKLYSTITVGTYNPGTTAYSYPASLSSSYTPSITTPSISPNKASIAVSTPSSAAYVIPGTYTWIAPAGVTSAAAVAIGGGGSGNGGSGLGGGGGGGALNYINGYGVTPGASYCVVVGGGGTVASCGITHDGGYSQVFGIYAYGGKKGTTISGSAAAGGTRSGGTGGGNGGAGGIANCIYLGAGGGGAGGYSGNGGMGGGYGGTSGSGANGSGGGAGGGGAGIVLGCYLGSNGGNGGGVGFFGQGSSGLGAAPAFNGGAGSCGCSNTSPNIYYSIVPLFGAGGGSGGGCYAGCCYYPNTGNSGTGGAVRIIWGAGRSFPSTNTYTP